MKVLFWIRRSAANKQGKAPLYFRLTVDGVQSKEKSTGLMAELTDWEPDKQRCNYNTYVNTQLMLITARLNEIHTYLSLSGQPITIELIFNYYYNKPLQQYPILALYDKFLHHCEELNKLAAAKGGKPYVEQATLKTYRYKRKHLAGYIATLANEPNGEDITAVWCENYTEWLYYHNPVKMERSTV
ncbi:Arm DNA-binding domain-containing protein, partial [Oscillatoria amoena NRMC-F 0135]|nr:Arm DNA-binding domain-containing protein [Oscillatoria amoena NRMC-F 0135]